MLTLRTISCCLFSLLSVDLSVAADSAPDSQNLAAPLAGPVGVSRWLVKLTPKASLAVGAQSKQEFGGTFQGAYDYNASDKAGLAPHQRFTLDLNADNTLTEKPGSSVRTHEYDGEAGYLRYFNPNIYWVSVAEEYHNSSLGLYLQQSFGTGIGGSKTFGERSSLELTVDARGVGEHFIGTAPAVTFAAIRLGAEYTTKLTNGKNPPELILTTRWIPALNEEKAWQARGRAVLVVPVGSAFSMTFSVADDYMENTPRKNYSNSSVGLTYAFTKTQ